MFEDGPLTGAKARRDRARHDMRQAIIDAAGQIIADEGIDKLTIRAVAGKLEYSPGALYEYFDSKEAILHALYFDGSHGLGTRCEQSIAALPEGASTIDALGALGRAYRSFALEHSEVYRLLFCTTTPPPEMDVPDTHLGGFGTLVRVAEHGVADGVLVDVPAPVIACAAWSAVHGFVSLEISGHVTGAEGPNQPPPPADQGRQRRDQLFEAVLRMVLLGFLREEYRPQRS